MNEDLIGIHRGLGKLGDGLLLGVEELTVVEGGDGERAIERKGGVSIVRVNRIPISRCIVL